MKNDKLSLKPASIPNTRWTAYALAGAATAFVGINCAEAEIHYSGSLNVRFPPNRDRYKAIRLGHIGSSLVFNHRFLSANHGRATVSCGFGLSVRGGIPIISSAGYVSKLSFGQNISSGVFFINVGYVGVLADGFPGNYSHWGNPGIGYLGFTFHSGTQYGWMRIRMSGPPLNGFVLVDYAYADPGEPITAGQTSSTGQSSDQGSPDEQIPDQGSLGGLALGAVGILAWRKRRSLPAR